MSDLDHFPQRYGVDSDALDFWVSTHRDEITGSEDTRPAVMALVRRLLRTQTRERLAGVLTVAVHRLADNPQASNDLTRLHRRIAELSEQSQRYRLAWMSARNRARSLDSDLSSQCEDLQYERDEARAEVVRLGKGFDQLRLDYERLSARLEEMVNDAIHHAATERLKAALTDEQVEERIEKIKRTARERIEARRLRAALDEERIEPEPVSEERIQRVIAAAGLDEGAFRPESLGEWPLDPPPETLCHGVHPHNGLRCVACRACTEGEAG